MKIVCIKVPKSVKSILENKTKKSVEKKSVR